MNPRGLPGALWFGLGYQDHKDSSKQDTKITWGTAPVRVAHLLDKSTNIIRTVYHTAPAATLFYYLSPRWAVWSIFSIPGLTPCQTYCSPVGLLTRL